MKPTICVAPSTNQGSVIPGRHRQVASPESIALGLWLWIPGSRKSAPRNDAAYDSKFKNVELVRRFADSLHFDLHKRDQS